MNEKLTELEFNAYELIKKFASERNEFFELTQIENGYDLKSESYHFKTIWKNQIWYLVVIHDEKEYYFDGTNDNFPFRNKRTYIGEWEIHFNDIIGK
ncbi:hypothetical protein [Epilithonimonas sp.]|uniref:hypothetical protein n=1 Tax=Epilithonimonas sp. TaxID=2894511 RepID=UPI00289AA15D|nr:hypothetical protein [Epilithonimonas sp.]